MLAIVLFASLTLASCGELCSTEAIQLYARLNAAAAMARHESELGAFLVRRSDGHLTALRWQPGEAAGATYTGRIPPGCIAIIHTHPIVAPQPSRHDIAEALRLRLPIVVITPQAISVATPEGTTTQLFDSGWNRR
jgi:proteasome lid subunit RPN8/RPN11